MSQNVEVQHVRRDGSNVLEVSVPHGTNAKELSRIHDTIFTDVIPRVTGHAGCLSGIRVDIRERWDVVAHLDRNGKLLDLRQGP